MFWPALMSAAVDAHGGGHINWFSWGERHEWPPLGFAIINFVLLLFLLHRLAWPKIRGDAAKRHEEVKRRLEEAKRACAEAEARLAEYERRLGDIDAEIESILRSIREEAEKERARLIAQSLEAADRLRKDAEFSLSQEAKQLRIDLERELATVSLQKAEAILRQRLDEMVDRRLQEEFLQSLQSRGVS